MKILFAASECVPFIKTGGLADVVGSLPVELARMGEDVRVMLPKYRIIDDYWKSRMEHVCDFYLIFGWAHVFCGVERVVDNGVTYYFIDNEEYFSVDNIYGDGISEGYRFAFFCRAVLEALPRLEFYPDVLHCNDWQTGMIPALLKIQYFPDEHFRKIKTVFSVHNLKYQGLFAWKEMAGRLAIDARYYSPDYLEFYGCLSFMKGGLVFADRILTVSPSYAEEIRTPYYGDQLDGLLRARGDSLSGILNGIDTVVYDPATDRYLDTHYDAKDLSGKAVNKQELQQACGLDVRPEVPVIGMIARLTPQKGLDLIERVLDDVMQCDLQMVFLGKGDKRFVDMLNWANWRYPRRLHARIALDDGLAHRIYAGADMFLMPSQFEPCGLSQMISLRYGTVPIVRETGGLKDSIQPYNQFTDEGNGFSFANYNAHEMLDTIRRAVGYYYDDKPMWQRLVARGMACDFGWTRSAEQYRALYWLLCPAYAPAQEPAEQAAPAPVEKPAPEKKPEPEKKLEPEKEPEAEKKPAPEPKKADEPKKKPTLEEKPKPKKSEENPYAAYAKIAEKNPHLPMGPGPVLPPKPVVKGKGKKK